MKEFVLPYGHGIDIVDLSRPEFDNLDFSKRYMTEKEYLYGLNNFKDNPVAYRNYNASIWSLKEAIVKATNHQVLFSNIEISFTSEAPICLLDNFILYLSVSFEKQYIIASAICYKK